MRKAAVVAFLGLAFLGTDNNLHPQDNPQGKILGHFRETYLEKLRGDSKSKIAACKDLADYSSAFVSFVSHLRALLERDNDPEVRIEAAKTIGLIGPSAAVAGRGPVVKTLAKALDDPDERVRIAALDGLRGVAPFSKKALPQVIAMMKHKSAVIRHKAIGVIFDFGPDAKEAVPALIEALNDPDPGIPGKVGSVRAYAMMALRQIGPEAKEATEILLKLNDLKDEELKELALGALTKIAPKDKKLMPLLLQTLKNKETPGLRAAAAFALGSLGAEAKEAIPDLIATIKAEDVRDRKLDRRIKYAVIVALGEIGPPAKDAIPAIQFVVNNTLDELLISQGRHAIEKIEGKSKPQ